MKVTVKFLQENYVKREEMVPMRDGVRLYTAVYEPNGTQARPVIVIRTPFPLNPYGKTFTRDLRTYMSLFAANKYIIVWQNVRGKFMSEGEFVNVRPLGGLVDEATDTYDTAQWLTENLNTNGCIGVKGMSYPGFYATMAALSGHPAIKAVSPQAPVTDWFMGDDVHISGLGQPATYSFGASFFRPRKACGIRWPSPVVNLPQGDIYDAFLDLDGRPLESLRDRLPFVEEMMQHPSYDSFWKERNAAAALKGKLPAFLVVAGLFDAEDSYGPFEVYRSLRAQAPQTESFLCIGPWYHGAWKKAGYTALGDAYFTPGSTEHFMQEIEFPFFEHYLAGREALPPRVSVLPSAETTKDGPKPCWKSYDSWPPMHEDLALYLCPNQNLPAAEYAKDRFIARCDGLLSPEPVAAPASVAFTSNPLRPVPYVDGPMEYFSREAFVADQRFAARRQDVFVFSTGVLHSPVKVEGKVSIDLNISIDNEDADIVVKLIDVRPDGYQLPVRIGAIPVRFRDSFEMPLPARPGECYHINVPLTDVAHHFEVGHRIMVQIQSTMFPLIQLPECKDRVEVSLHCGPLTATALHLPVVK